MPCPSLRPGPRPPCRRRRGKGPGTRPGRRRAGGSGHGATPLRRNPQTAGRPRATRSGPSSCPLLRRQPRATVPASSRRMRQARSSCAPMRFWQAGLPASPCTPAEALQRKGPFPLPLRPPRRRHAPQRRQKDGDGRAIRVPSWRQGLGKGPSLEPLGAAFPQQGRCPESWGRPGSGAAAPVAMRRRQSASGPPGTAERRRLQGARHEFQRDGTLPYRLPAQFRRLPRFGTLRHASARPSALRRPSGLPRVLPLPLSFPCFPPSSPLPCHASLPFFPAGLLAFDRMHAGGTGSGPSQPGHASPSSLRPLRHPLSAHADTSRKSWRAKASSALRKRLGRTLPLAAGSPCSQCSSPQACSKPPSAPSPASPGALCAFRQALRPSLRIPPGVASSRHACRSRHAGFRCRPAGRRRLLHGRQDARHWFAKACAQGEKRPRSSA